MSEPIDIAALRALAEAATPGPWCAHIYMHGRYVDHDISGPKREHGGEEYSITESLIESDADLIVALRNSAPALLDAVERLRDYEDDARRVQNEDCVPDEKHCSCVPHLIGKGWLPTSEAMLLRYKKEAAERESASRLATIETMYVRNTDLISEAADARMALKDAGRDFVPRAVAERMAEALRYTPGYVRHVDDHDGPMIIARIEAALAEYEREVKR